MEIGYFNRPGLEADYFYSDCGLEVTFFYYTAGLQTPNAQLWDSCLSALKVTSCGFEVHMKGRLEQCNLPPDCPRMSRLTKKNER